MVEVDVRKAKAKNDLYLAIGLARLAAHKRQETVCFRFNGLKIEVNPGEDKEVIWQRYSAAWDAREVEYRRQLEEEDD